MAGTGAAAVGTAAVAPDALASGAHDDSGSITGDGPIVAYVSDVRRGDVSVMKGEREVVIHDRALCAALARALT